jgi:hypothetical protein
MKVRAPAAEAAAVEVEVKVVGKSGQISLGKRYAGKTLRLERRPGGTVVLTPVAMVPESQLWTLDEPHRSLIAQGLHWAATTRAAETDLDDLVKTPSRATRPSRGRRR